MKSRTISIIGWRRTRRNWRGLPIWKIRGWRSLSVRCRARLPSMPAQKYLGWPSGMSVTKNTGWNCSNRTHWDAMRWKSARRKRIEKTWKCLSSRKRSAILRNRHNSTVFKTSSMPTRRKRMQSWRNGVTPRNARLAVRVWYRWKRSWWIGQRWPLAASKNSRWTCRGWNSIRVSTNRCSQDPSSRKTSALICSSNAKPKLSSQPSASNKAYRTNSTALRPVLNRWLRRFPLRGTRRISMPSKNLSLRSKLIEQI